jgi:hypothetical protein
MPVSKLITVKKAQDEVKRLQYYLDLVENYSVDTIEKWVIKEYAYTNSMLKVVRSAYLQSITQNGQPVDKAFVFLVLNSDAQADELHLLLQSGYKSKVKASHKARFTTQH